ncbi:MAG: hypothetical protein K2R98_19345 [Gemmataceae bacterium]|nr:hypothetical protein [Gemmataceae bacterium]
MKIEVITACSDYNGMPTFVRTVVEATPEQRDNGDHYDAAEHQLEEQGYGGPFVHFDQNDAKRFPWLSANVK